MQGWLLEVKILRAHMSKDFDPLSWLRLLAEIAAVVLSAGTGVMVWLYQKPAGVPDGQHTSPHGRNGSSFLLRQPHAMEKRSEPLVGVKIVEVRVAFVNRVGRPGDNPQGGENSQSLSANRPRSGGGVGSLRISGRRQNRPLRDGLFNLVRIDGKWMIASVADTGRKNCSVK